MDDLGERGVCPLAVGVGVDPELRPEVNFLHGQLPDLRRWIFVCHERGCTPREALRAIGVFLVSEYLEEIRKGSK